MNNQETVTLDRSPAEVLEGTALILLLALLQSDQPAFEQLQPSQVHPADSEVGPEIQQA